MSRFRSWNKTIKIGICIIGLAYILPAFGSFFPLLELFAHFKPHLAFLAAGLGMIALLVRFFRTAVLALAMSAAIIIHIWPYSVETLGDEADANVIKIVDLNVLKTNPDPAAVIRFLRQEKATFVALQEVTPDWQNRLKALSDEYSFMTFNNTGLKCCIGLLSKIPWESVQTLQLSPKGPDIIRAHFNLENMVFSIVVTHLDPPKPPQFGYNFHHHLQTNLLGKTLKSFAGPFILVGDLNTTHWAPSFERIIAETGLRRMGEGILPTWPAQYISVGIPLDHILATKEFKFSTLTVGPNVQSDHLPLIAEFGL